MPQITPTHVWHAAVAFAAFVLLAVTVRALLAGRLGGGRRTRCGRCHHEAAEPLSDLCPECGADYVQSGLITPDLRRRFAAPLLITLAAWTACVALTAGAFWRPAELRAVQDARSSFFRAQRQAPTVSHTRQEFDLEITPFQWGGAAAYDLELRGELNITPDNSLRPSAMEFKLRTNGGEVSILDVVLPARTWSARPPINEQIDPTFGRGTLEAFFVAAELDPDNDRRKRELDELSGMIDSFIDSPSGALERAMGGDPFRAQHRGLESFGMGAFGRTSGGGSRPGVYTAELSPGIEVIVNELRAGAPDYTPVFSVESRRRFLAGEQIVKVTLTLSKGRGFDVIATLTPGGTWSIATENPADEEITESERLDRTVVESMFDRLGVPRDHEQVVKEIADLVLIAAAVQEDPERVYSGFGSSEPAEFKPPALSISGSHGTRDVSTPVTKPTQTLAQVIAESERRVRLRAGVAAGIAWGAGLLALLLTRPRKHAR